MFRMLSVLILFCALTVSAAEFTVTVTVPDNRLVEMQAAIDAWMAKQKNPDGTLKYATRALALRAIVAEGLRDFFANVQPITSVQAQKAAIRAAEQAIEAEKAAVQ